jgi:hypothetical protein
VLTEGSFTGHTDTPSAGRRFIGNLLNGNGTPGAPVLNEFGELVGLLGGSNVPGATTRLDLLRYRAELRGIPIVPLNLVRMAERPAAENVARLQERGDLVLPCFATKTSCRGFARLSSSDRGCTADQRDQFSIQDKTFVTWINWGAQERLRGVSMLRVHDADNRVIIESKPGKIDIRKGDLKLSSWTLPVPAAAGMYRVKALIDGKPIWRGFVRITQ